MTTQAPKDDLALERVMPHHRAAWRAERIAWAVGTLALVAALLGLFGYGPLSRTTAGSRDTLAVVYDRLQRSSAPSEYAVTANASLVRDGALRLRLDQALVDGMELDSVVPEPERVVAGRGYTEFVFNTVPDGDARIVFRFRPTTFGQRRGHLTVPGAPPVAIDHFTYP